MMNNYSFTMKGPDAKTNTLRRRGGFWGQRQNNHTSTNIQINQFDEANLPRGKKRVYIQKQN